jgi:hypothetical protein
MFSNRLFKRFFFVLISIAVLAVLYFIFSLLYANYQTHKSFTSEMSYFDRFGVKYELIEQQRGLFSSVYKTKLTAITTDDDITMGINHQAEFGIKSFDIFKIGTIKTSYEYDNYTKNLLEKNSLADVAQETVFDIRFDGMEAFIKIEPKSFETTKDYYGKDIISTYNGSGGSYYVKGSFDSKTFFVKQYIENIEQNSIGAASVGMKNVTFDINLHRNSLNTWLGEIKFGAKDYHIISQNNNFNFNTHLVNYMANIAATEQKNDLMALSFKTATDEFVLSADTLNVTIKDMLVDVVISELEQNTINAVVNKLSKINLKTSKRDKDLTLFSISGEMISLLKTHPSITVNIKGTPNDWRTAEVAAYIKYTGDNIYGINLSNWKEYFDFEIKYSLDKKMVVAFLEQDARKKYERVGLSIEEIEVLVEKSIEFGLDNLKKLGATIEQDMITGVLNKNTKLNSIY